MKSQQTKLRKGTYPGHKNRFGEYDHKIKKKPTTLKTGVICVKKNVITFNQANEFDQHARTDIKQDDGSHLLNLNSGFFQSNDEDFYTALEEGKHFKVFKIH